ncbi:MAG: ABC transporter ATP-binding protein [Pseudomonadota bacterium]
MAAIEIRGVAKRFDMAGGEVNALDGISLELPSGGFYALIGPSGCGKSTLLRLIADILQPTEGRITIDDHPPATARRNHEIGFVFQEPALLPWRTVRDNVALPFEISRQRPGPRQSPDALIDLVGLTGFEDARPAQLSGGMQQRVSIARALALRPKVLLLDEPFGALDEITRQRLNLETLRIWRQSNTTAILVTHTISEAVFMADRVIVMSAHPGRIVADIDVDLPRPRALGLMKEARFHSAENAVRDALFGDDLGSIDTAPAPADLARAS